MYRFAVTLALALGFGVLSAPGLPTSTPTEAKIKLLVEQLSSNDARKREDAAKELESVGMPALEALRKAAKSEDAEVSRVAKKLVSSLEAKLANQKLLEPTWVNLKLKDATVSEAVAELAKQSGFPISVGTLTKEKLQRKITLDTGKVPFWTALDKLCEVAQIRESEALANGSGAVQPVFENIGVRIAPAIRAVPVQPVPVVPAVEVQKEQKEEKPKEEKKDEPKKEEPKKAEPKKEEVKKEEAKKAEPKPVMPVAPAIEAIQVQGQAQGAIQVQIQGGQIQVQGVPIQVQGGAMPIQIQPFQMQPANVPVSRRVGIVTLEEGKAKEVPTHVEGAFRIRSMAHLPITAYVPNVGADELVFLLQAQAEPRINVLNTARVKIDKAIDENGQNLSASEPKADAAPPQPIPLNGGPAPLIIRRTNITANVIAYNNQPFPVRLKKGDKETKTIKELTGTVTFSVRGEAEQMVEIEDLAKAKDDTVKGKNDCSLKVTEMTKGEDGVYTLKVEISSPTTVVPFIHQPTEEERKRVLDRAQAAQPAQPAQNVVRNVPARALITHGLELSDAKGNAYDPVGIVRSQGRVQNATQAFQVEIKFAPKEKGQGEPTKLVFKGTRPAEVEVPFTLKDIVLSK